METEKQHFIDELRGTNEKKYRDAIDALASLLDASLDHEWMYIFELAQNALDAGARRLFYASDGTVLSFQHDGADALAEKHVKALSRIGGSTKGLSTIGFMGVGFKAAFSRFRTARVCGSDWRFRFDVDVDKGASGVELTRWIDTVLPHWDPDLEDPDPGFTTLFRMERPIRHERPLANDLSRLEANGLTPLAVLAARGLRQLTIGETNFNLKLENGEIRIDRDDTLETRRWHLFRASYTPTDAAMAEFLKVRRQLNEELTDDGRRREREVIALLPLDDNGMPVPPDQAFAYTTLPTQDRTPTGFHIQADWLVNVDRQRLRDIDGNAWQEEILAQVPNLIGLLLEWLASPELIGRATRRRLPGPAHPECRWGPDRPGIGEASRRRRRAAVGPPGRTDLRAGRAPFLSARDGRPSRRSLPERLWTPARLESGRPFRVRDLGRAADGSRRPILRRLVGLGARLGSRSSALARSAARVVAEPGKGRTDRRLVGAMERRRRTRLGRCARRAHGGRHLDSGRREHLVKRGITE